MQNTTIKLEKHTLSRKTKKKNTAIKAVLILAMLCCLFSTIAQATEATYDANSINRYGIYKYESLDDTGLTYTGNLHGTIQNNGATYNTNLRTTYTTQALRLWISIDPVIIQTASIEFEIYALFDNGEKYVPTVTLNRTLTTINDGPLNPYRYYFRSYNYGNSNYTTLNLPSTFYTSSEGFSNIDVTNGQNITNKYNITLKRHENYIEYKTILKDIQYKTNEFVLSIPVTYISSTLVLDNINITINDKVYQIVNKLENTVKQIEQGQEDAINAVNPNGIEGVMNDLQNNLENTLTEIVKYNNNTLNAIFYANILSGSAVMQIVMMISMTITIISYIIFGKYK